MHVFSLQISILQETLDLVWPWILMIQKHFSTTVGSICLAYLWPRLHLIVKWDASLFTPHSKMVLLWMFNFMTAYIITIIALSSIQYFLYKSCVHLRLFNYAQRMFCVVNVAPGGTLFILLRTNSWNIYKASLTLTWCYQCVYVDKM